jgi:hypothetical protein
MPKKSKTLIFYYINENDGGFDAIYKEDGLDYWMCPTGTPFAVFDAAEEAIWNALSDAYKLKKDGLTYDEVILTVKGVIDSFT